MVLLAESRDGVVTRRQLRERGVSRFVLRQEEREGRVRIDRQAVRVVGAAVGERARWRRALANSCPTAALDGVTALCAHGLVGFTDELVHLGIPRGGAARSRAGVRVHVLRSWDPADVVTVDGLRLVRPDVAAVRAARWVRSDRAAATILAMCVQQGIVRADELISPAAGLPRHRRNGFTRAVIDEIAGGCEALGEIDFAQECRRRGLPEPERQELLQRPGGRWYLDVRWRRFGVVAEIDGVQHQLPERATSDALKQNESTLGSERVLKLTTLAVRIGDERFYRQLERALRMGGWIPSECHDD